MHFSLTKTICTFLFCTIIISNGFAQLNTAANLEEAILSTSDRTYVSFGQGIGNYKTPYGIQRLKPLIFEGQISPNFNLSIAKRRAIGLSFFPKIVIRMYNQYSKPVKTPSYMPSILLYYQLNWPFTKKIFRFFSAEEQLVFLTARVIHHSNGQEGSYYINGTDSVNFKNGNFSTNAFEIAFSWSAIDSSALGKSFANGRLKYERQLEFERESLLLNNYYYNKISIESHVIYSEKIKAYITYAFMWGRPSFKLRNSFDLFIVAKPIQRLSNFSIFVRAYVGPDYYNLYFQNSLRTITFGLIADPMYIPILKKIKRKQTKKMVIENKI